MTNDKIEVVAHGSVQMKLDELPPRGTPVALLHSPFLPENRTEVGPF